MSSFYTAESRFFTMTQAELDRIAVESQGVLSTLPGGFGCHDRHNLPDTARFGWELRVINTRGTGNNGTYVLIPTDGRTRELKTQGWVSFFRKEYKLSAARANTLARAMKGVCRTHESGVQAAALSLLGEGCKQALASEPPGFSSHAEMRAWLDRWLPHCDQWGAGMSLARKSCALLWAHRAALGGWYEVVEGGRE